MDEVTVDYSRDVREWLSTFPFPPIPIPIPNSVFYSHSHGIPSPVGNPIPMHISRLQACKLWCISQQIGVLSNNRSTADTPGGPASELNLAHRPHTMRQCIASRGSE